MSESGVRPRSTEVRNGILVCAGRRSVVVVVVVCGQQGRTHILAALHWDEVGVAS